MSDREELIALRRLAELEAKASGAAPATAQKAKESPTSVGNLVGAAVEPSLTMASGMLSTPVAGLAGLLTTVGQGLGLDKIPLLGSVIPKESPADVVRGVQSRFTYEPNTEGGKNALSVIGAPFDWLEQGADYVGGKVTDWTGDPVKGAQAKVILAMLPAAVAGGVAPKGALPRIAQASRGGAEALMRSVLKPSSKDVRTGKAPKAIETMLDEGVSVSEGGANKLGGKIDTLNDAIMDAISSSKARVSRQAVETPVYQVEQQFSRQADPQSDLAAISAVLDDFRNHPLLPRKDIPVQVAQELKQGTYKALKDKYGEVGSASTEAQKALARGLKDEIAAAVPEVSPLNAQESALLNARNMLEARLAIEGNKNPLGLSPLAGTGARTAAFMADRSAHLKSLIARAMNPGRGMGITDEMMMLASAPETFSESSLQRQAIIDALLNRSQR